jgi:hypothetical protein
MAVKPIRYRRPWRPLLLAALAGWLAACAGLQPTIPPDQAYRLLKFDSETGEFAARLAAADARIYWQQWKKARRVNYLLNPDDAHGRQCGTHGYLHAKWLLKSPWLPDFSFFLIRPGQRPCDYDEPCTPVGGSQAVTCAHTQYLLDFPVVIGPQGNPYRDYAMDRAFFNALIQSQAVTVEGRDQAEQVARLYLFLTTTGRRNAPVEIEALEARPAGNHFQVRARLRTAMPPESSVQFFDVAADGSIVDTE